jgi:predicted DNA-binding protein
MSKKTKAKAPTTDTNPSALIALRLPAKLLWRVDERAARLGATRSATLRVLIEKGLKR